MTADNSAAGLTAQLAETWTATAALCRPLNDDEWDRPTACPGWTIKDQVAHIVGTESMLAGQPIPSVADPAAPDALHVRNEIGRLNEMWIAAARPLSGPEVLDRLEQVTAARLDALRALSEHDWDAPSKTPVGEAPYRRFMQIRVFDCWVHELDICDALTARSDANASVEGAEPSCGQAAEQAVDEVERALGVLVGKRAGAPEGSRLTLSLTGPIERDIHVAVSGRAAVVDHLDRDPDVALFMSSPALMRLACGRVDPQGALDAGVVAVEGDRELGERVVRHLPFTI